MSQSLFNRHGRAFAPVVAVLVTIAGLSGIATASTAQAAAKPSVLRVNSGGEPFFEKNGNYWASDRYATGGKISADGTTTAGTTDQRIFTYQRWGLTSYDFPVVNGKYTVKLYLSEAVPNLPTREFGVTAEGKPVFASINIRNEAGGDNIALVKTFTTTVKDGKLNVGFVKQINEPTIAGIEIQSLATTSSTPDFQKETGVPSMKGWSIVPEVSDDFSGKKVNSDKWKVYEPAPDGGGMISPEAVTVSSGLLNITGQNKVSGGMRNRAPTGPGRWVIRFREDKGRGYGATALMWPQSDDAEQGGELDFFEIPKANRKIAYSFVHGVGDTGDSGYHNVGDFSIWHTMTVERTTTKVTYWLDSKKAWSSSNAKAVPPGQMHFVLQQNIAEDKCETWVQCFNGKASEAAKVRFQVDYVHFYAAS